MASVFAALMNARSRFLWDEQPGFVPDLPLQLANPFFESPLERRNPVKREIDSPVKSPLNFSPTR
jgi:hypothetical protein